MAKEKRDPETYAIIGAAMAVHRTLGCGFLEAVYQEALAIELGAQGVPFMTQAPLTIRYRGRALTTSYRADFLCFDTVIVELKALPRLSGLEEAQLLNYLKASQRERGLLLNFGTQTLEYKRIIWSEAGRGDE